jgi:hypothetical protein
VQRTLRGDGCLVTMPWQAEYKIKPTKTTMPAKQEAINGPKAAETECETATLYV